MACIRIWVPLWEFVRLFAQPKKKTGHQNHSKPAKSPYQKACFLGGTFGGGVRGWLKKKHELRGLGGISIPDVEDFTSLFMVCKSRSTAKPNSWLVRNPMVGGWANPSAWR